MCVCVCKGNMNSRKRPRRMGQGKKSESRYDKTATPGTRGPAYSSASESAVAVAAGPLMTLMMLH